MAMRTCIALLILLIWSISAWAVLPDQASYDKLRDDILVVHEAEFHDRVTGNQWSEIAASYNALAVPDYWVRRTDVPRYEVLFATSVDGTNFTFTGTEFLAKTQQEITVFNMLFETASGRLDASLPRVIQALQDIFGAGSPNITHIRAIARRKARRIEQLLVTSGAGTTAQNGIMGYQGTISDRDIAYALGKIPVP